MSKKKKSKNLVENKEPVKNLKKEYKNEVASIVTDPKYYVTLDDWFANPDELVSTKQEEIELYDQVFFDPVGYQAFEVRIGTLKGKDWDIIPPENPTPEEQKATDFINKTLRSTNFDELRGELLKSICYGIYGAEVIYEKIGNYIGVKKFVGKHPRRFTFKGSEELMLLTKMYPCMGEPVPPNKFIVMNYGDSGNPYGQGIGRTIWHFVWFKHGCIKFWMVYLERFGSPILLGKYNSDEQKSQVLSVLRDIQQNSSAVLKGNLADDIRYLEAQRSGTSTHEQLTNYCDNQITRAILGQTLTSDVGSNGSGSRALGVVHNEVRQNILESDRDILDGTLNNTIIKWLVDWNFNIDPDRYPQLVTYTTPKPNLLDRVKIDEILITKIGLKVGDDYLYERYEIPKPDKKSIIVEPSGSGSNISSPSFAESVFTPEQQVVEDIVNKTVAKSSNAKENIVKQLKSYLSSGKPLETIQSQLFAEYADISMDSIEKLISEAILEVQKHGEQVANDKVDKLNA